MISTKNFCRSMAVAPIPLHFPTQQYFRNAGMQSRPIRSWPEREPYTNRTSPSPRVAAVRRLYSATVLLTVCVRAVRERVAGGFEYFRLARQAFCRRFAVADPLPLPELAGPAKPLAEATIKLSQIPEIEPAEHPWGPLLAGRTPVVEPLARFVPRD